MKMIDGAASLACLKRSRTREAPTPTIASTNSEAERWKKAACASPGHRAGEQRLAGAGQPVEQDAVGDPRPELGVALRVFEEVDDLFQLVLGLVDPGDVLEGDSVLLARLDPPRGRAAEAAEDAAPSAPGLSAASQMKKPMISSDGRKPSSSVPSTERPVSGDSALIDTSSR